MAAGRVVDGNSGVLVQVPSDVREKSAVATVVGETVTVSASGILEQSNFTIISWGPADTPISIVPARTVF